MKKLLLCMSLCLLSSTAFAADAVVDEFGVVDEAFNWSGVYVGVQGGYAFGHSDWVAHGIADTAYENFEPAGGFGGSHVAARWQLDTLTLGAEAELNIADLTDGRTAVGGEFESKIGWFGSLTAEVGLPLDRFLLYVNAGLAIADIDNSLYVDIGPIFEPFTVDWENQETGWVLGAGGDYAVTDHIIVGARYRYYDFGTSSFPSQVTPTGNSAPTDIDTNFHAFSFKAAYKF